MQALRRHCFLARFVLAWFVLWIGAGVLSPALAEPAFGVLCTVAGHGSPPADPPAGQPADQAMHCPGCVTAAAPPLGAPTGVPLAIGEAVAPDARVVPLLAQHAPLSASARGPPFIS